MLGLKTKLRNLAYWLRSSLWLAPALLVLLAVALAAGLPWLDSRWNPPEYPLWVYGGEADGARQIMATVAGSMATVGGVVFSVTMVAFTMASTQFGPRILRNFMRDMGNQVVLGAFVATFLYCLLVLRQIDGVPGGTGVPHIAVTTGVLLGAVDLVLFIYFIHHVSESVQADFILDQVSRELEKSLDHLYPEPMGTGGSQVRHMPLDLPGENSGALPVEASQAGYIQTVVGDGLLEMARKGDLVLRLEVQPGDFVTPGRRLLTAWTSRDGLPADFAEKANNQFLLGAHRTPTQDLLYNLERLVEIILRALSASLNDTITAMKGVDRMGQYLSRAAAREYPTPYRRDAEGRLRIVAHPVFFPRMVESAFDPIYPHCRGNVEMCVHAVRTLQGVAANLRRREDWQAVFLQGERFGRRDDFGETRERGRVDEAALRFRKEMERVRPRMDRAPAGAGSEERID